MFSTEARSAIDIQALPRIGANATERASLNIASAQGIICVTLTRGELQSLIGEAVQAWGELGVNAKPAPGVSTADIAS